MITSATIGTSIPLEATSVATSIFTLLLRNFAMDCSLLTCDMSPSIVTASILSLCRYLLTSLVLYFVEQNMMHCPWVSRRNCITYLNFSLSLITRNDWSMPSPLRSSASKRNCFGLLR